MNANILSYAEKGVLSEMGNLAERTPQMKGSISGNNPDILERYINQLEEDYNKHIRLLKLRNASYRAIYNEPRD